MTTKWLASVAILLWVLTAAFIGPMLIGKDAVITEDSRRSILLTSDEKALALTEMRGFLESVQQILVGIDKNDKAIIQQSATRSGMGSAGGVPAAMMAKLPLEFKQLGLSVHFGFDELSVAAQAEETNEMILSRLTDQLGHCVACHAAYRIDVE